VTAVQEHASLHEKAVQKVAADQHSLPKRRRKRGASKHGKVEASRLHPLVEEYLQKQGFDRKRVQILPGGEAVVWNHTHWRGSSVTERFSHKTRAKAQEGSTP
jgi:hypothetical protein